MKVYILVEDVSNMDCPNAVENISVHLSEAAAETAMEAEMAKFHRYYTPDLDIEEHEADE